MAEHVFPDIETEFSPRVTGIGFWKKAYVGSMWEEGEDWFGKKPQPEKKPRGTDGTNGGQEERDGRQTDDDDEDGRPVVTQIHTNDYELGFGWRYPEMDRDRAEPDFSRYARSTKHQRTAVPGCPPRLDARAPARG
jgi:hypothetical protein